MYQTHPFRDGVTVGNPEFMHGAEAFNGHFHHENHNEQAKEFCRVNGLLPLSGTDYHHDPQPVTAGIYAPDDIQDEKQLVQCIFEKNYTLVQNEEEYKNALQIYKASKRNK